MRFVILATKRTFMHDIMTIVSCSRLFSFYIFLFLLIITIISQTNAQPNFSPNCDNDKGNYTLNSTYHNNLNTLLSNLSSNKEVTYGFYNFSYGQNTDKAYAIGLCRGDVNPDDCRKCLNNSRVLLTQKYCTNQKEAIGWDDNCMLRYSNRSIFGLLEAIPGLSMWVSNNATEVYEYNQVLGNLLQGLRNRASRGDSRVKYATAHADGPNFQHIYGLMQCTPDLDELECDECLGGAIGGLSLYCPNKVGCRVNRPSCNIRYENSQFYQVTTAEAPPPSTSSSTNNTTSSEGKGNAPRIAIILAVPIVVVLVLCFICISLRRKKPRKIIKR